MSDYTQGLRDLADWLDAHLDWSAPEPVRVTFYQVGDGTETPELVRGVVREMAEGGTVDKQPGSSTFTFVRHFGPVSLCYVVLRSTVCVARVVGTRRVEATFTPAHDEEIVEWDCAPILVGEEANHAFRLCATT